MLRARSPLGQDITDEACLGAVMTARGLDGACPACGAVAPRIYLTKQRAFGCSLCGFKVYPVEGTPFAGSRRPLADWFLALQLAARNPAPLTGRSLARSLGIRFNIASDMARTVEALRGPGRDGIDWLDVARGFDLRLPLVRPPRSAALIAAALRAPGAGLAGIALLAAAAMSLASVSVPEPPTGTEDHAAASVVLALAADENVLLVSAEDARRLYDVSDLDADAPTPLAPRIRVVPERPATGEAPRAAALPVIKLAAAVAASLLRGDYASVRQRAGERPELAAYGALAQELQAGATGNPDDLLVFGPVRIRRHLVEKIVRAAGATGMDPVLLMAIADKESSFATAVQAKTSSATGLFQFIESTWLRVVRDYGARYGLGAESRSAAALVEASATVPAEERSRILDLRRDAYLSAALAAEMLKNDGEPIARRLGRPLTGGETYLVHFLGPEGAMRLLDRARSAPDAVAAELLPKPAAANRSIFFATDPAGAAKGLSVAEVRDRFESMIGLRLDRYRAVRSLPGAPQTAPAAQR